MKNEIQSLEKRLPRVLVMLETNILGKKLLKKISWAFLPSVTLRPQPNYLMLM